jgi:hypothetical protein
MPITPSQSSSRVRTTTLPALAVVLSCLAVSACGGSSNHATNATVTTHTAIAQTTVSVPGGTPAANAQHSSNPSGAHSPGGATGSGGGGAGNSGGGNEHANNGNTPSNAPHSSTSSKYPPAFVAAVKTFASCVRSHGVSIPEPNFSGHGEVFGKAHINPNDPNYRNALQACESDLIAILRSTGGSHIQGIG